VQGSRVQRKVIEVQHQHVPQEDEKIMKQICIVKHLNNISKELIEDKSSKESENLNLKCYID